MKHFYNKVSQDYRNRHREKEAWLAVADELKI